MAANNHPGLGFNGVVIDLQQHFETYLNYQILPKFTNKIYDNVADFRQLRAVESHPTIPYSQSSHPQSRQFASFALGMCCARAKPTHKWCWKTLRVTAQ